jgi:hypothetical protein
VFSTGFVSSAYRSVTSAAGAVSLPFWLQRCSLFRWVYFTMALHTFACAAHRCLLDGIPGLRLPGSAVYPRFRPLRTSRRLGGYVFTPAPGGRGLHPHGELSYKACGCAVCPRTSVLFRPTVRTKLSYTWYNASCCRKPSSPLHRVVTRRPTAATCWRRVRLIRLQSMEGSLPPRRVAERDCSRSAP